MGLLELASAATAVAGLALWRRNTNSLRPDTEKRSLGIVITGSTKGLGLAMAREFLACGDSVVVNGRSAAAVETAKLELQPFCKSGQKLIGVVADVSTADGCETLGSGAQASLGRIDLWINNAGAGQQPKAPLTETPAETIETVLRANLHGALFGCRAALSLMLQQPGHAPCAIFNMDGSGSRGNATPNAAAYGASKAALPQLAKSVAREIQSAPHVSIHTASPGMVVTELLLNSANAGPKCEGPVDKRALKAINILAEQPQTTASWLVPRMRGALGRPSGEYIRYLTASSAAWRFLTARSRTNRHVEVPP